MGVKVNGSSLALVLFGVVFLGIGGGAGFFSARTLARAEEMRAWRETPAEVEACDLNVSRSSKGGASYRASAQYRYEVGGVSYRGDRVSLHSGSDNIGRFHQRVYAELKRCMDRKEATRCWVNPANPSEAILLRLPRAELLGLMQLFVLAFGGAGLGIVLNGLSGLLQPSAGVEPSMRQGQIRMSGTSAHRVAGLLALAWNGYVGWFLWRVWVVTAPELMPWYLWLLAATGLVPAGIAGYLVGRFRKFGVSVFEMSPMPGVLGGPVSGAVRIPARVETEDGFELVLQCIHQYTTGSGKQRSTHRHVLWEDARHIAAAPSYGEETMLPVRFAAPYEQPATTAAGGSSGYYWRLKASAAAPGIDYKAVFDVPVQRTPQSSPAFVPQQMPDPTVGRERVEEMIARASLRLERHSDGGFELIFPAARALSAVLFFTVFAAGWSGMCFALWTVAKAPPVFALAFTLVDAVLVMALLNMLFVSRGIVVDRERREYRVWWCAAGLSKRERRIPFDEVTDVRSERSGQSGNTVYYRVVLVAKGGRSVTVGDALKMWNDAEDIARLLLAATKPDVGASPFH